MKKIRFTINRKIIVGFLTLILIFAAFAVYTIFTVNKGNAIIKKSLNVINPTKDAIVEFRDMVTRSKMLITNWVYLQTNDEDKRALEALHKTEYPSLKDQLGILLTNVEQQEELPDMDTIFIQFEALIDIEKNIMNELQKFEDYEDPIKKFMAEDAIESEVLPRSAALIKTLQNYNSLISDQKSVTDEGMIKNFEQLSNMTYILSVIVFIIGLFTAFYISKSITRPINYIRGVIDKVGKGEIVDVDKSKVSNDEIGDMSESVANMAGGFSEITQFAENIGNGKYDHNFKPLSENDALGNALIEMRDNLKKVSEEDKKRNWATSGIAKFGEILRSYSDNFEKLSDEIISNLVKYIDANQGALFVVATNGEGEEEHMEMASCYAWDKKKFIDRKIHRGEGLTGQAWLEGDIIYLTEVPESYITITSGLGEANPTSIIIVPLKVNDEIHGVIEIASFKEYEEFEIEFIERISESIASTFSTVKVNERTQKLLHESTMMTEQMRAQEEEMRQNMEELQATQEKIQRDQLDRDSREKIVISDTLVLELSRSFSIRKTNELSKEVLGYAPSEIEGRLLKDLVTSSNQLSEIQEKALTETFWNGILKMKNRNGEEVSLLASAGQVPDSIDGDHMYIIYGKNVSQLIKDKEEV
jgi:PAS domain S-box-containing protein